MIQNSHRRLWFVIYSNDVVISGWWSNNIPQKRGKLEGLWRKGLEHHTLGSSGF